ncbi:AEC family transporter [bacterium LRH843]|nr:AEC family transporter [bacterium LRH843]
MHIFLEVIFPVVLVFIVGFMIQKRLKVDIKAISTLVVYVFIPCLVFRTLSTTVFDTQYMYVIGFAVLQLVFTVAIVKVYVKMRKLPSNVESGLILSTAFMNAGNFGVPIILFAYGTTGFDYAISFFVLSQILLNSIGLYYAARGAMSIKHAFQAVFKLPMIYAVIFALLLKGLNVQLPENIFTMISFIGDAGIPCVMVILGMQLAQIEVRNFKWELLSFATIVRLFIAPIIAFGITQILTIDPLLQKVLIVIAALPTASSATIFAIQFDSDAELVSGATLLTTIISFITVAALISIMG